MRNLVNAILNDTDNNSVKFRKKWCSIFLFKNADMTVFEKVSLLSTMWFKLDEDATVQEINIIN